MQGQEKMDVSAATERVSPPFHHLFLLCKPSVGCMMPAHMGSAVFLTLSTDSNANFFQRPSHRHTPKLCFTSNLVTPWLSQADP